MDHLNACQSELASRHGLSHYPIESIYAVSHAEAQVTRLKTEIGHENM
jgi:hypothetical protein